MEEDITYPNKEKPSFLQLHVVLRVLQKLLFISVVLAVSTFVCSISYPLLDRIVFDVKILTAGKPEKPPSFDDFHKNRMKSREDKVIDAFDLPPASHFADLDRKDHDRVMANYEFDTALWDMAKDGWQSSLALAFLGFSGVLFSLVLIGFAFLIVRSEKFPTLRAPP